MPASVSQTALLTGASSGIGYELAKVFAQDGINLVLVARREALLHQVKAELEQQYGVHVTTITADLAEPGQAAAVYAQCQAQGVVLDYLVNNAGYGTYGPVAREAAATYDNLLTLDVLAQATA
jgi:short-subunit dehydrogenase